MSQTLHIVCVSGTREKLQMAAMVASVAAAGGTDVTVFFSMNALTYFVEGKAEAAPAEGVFGGLMEDSQGVPDFRKLFKMAAELGDAKLLPCSMALDLMNVTEASVDPDFGPPTGLTSFLSAAESGRLLSF
jgi:peroxiredoxin family protein